MGKVIKMPCPACSGVLEIIPAELFGDDFSLVVTGCNECDIWWINIPCTQIEDFDALMRMLGKVVETGNADGTRKV